MLSRIVIPLLFAFGLVTQHQTSASPVLLWSNANLPRSSVSLSTIKSLNFLSESICNLTNEKVQIRLFVVNDLTQDQIQRNSPNQHSILTEAKKADSAFRYFPNVDGNIYKTLSSIRESNSFRCSHIHFDVTSIKEFENLDGALDSIETTINTLGVNTEQTVVMAILGKPSNIESRRSRRSVEDPENIVISNDGTCMFYAKELILRNISTTGTTMINYILDLENSTCLTSNNDSVLLNLMWYNEKDENLTITMKVNVTLRGSYWYLQEALIDNIGYRYFAFGMNSKMDTPNAFSYACTTANFVKYNASTKFGQYDFNQLADIVNLQFQPFAVNGSTFGPVNYCTSFFTTGIWMGLTSSLLCLGILLFGIGRIMSIKSNDRLDDPKGKPLVIKAQE